MHKQSAQALWQRTTSPLWRSHYTISLTHSNQHCRGQSASSNGVTLARLHRVTTPSDTSSNRLPIAAPPLNCIMSKFLCRNFYL